MEKYIFSGGLSKSMSEYLMKIPNFDPMDVLVSQLDRSSIKEMIRLKSEGVVKSLFIDSGAFSQYTEAVGHIDVDEYISFVNSIDDHTSLVAQLDTLPGKFGKAKTPEDYVESSRLSWENYLYMRDKLKSPEKLIPVFHYGESFSTLMNMLDWRSESGEHVEVIGLSPANDTSQSTKNIYLRECYDLIASSTRPDAKTHLFGMTSLDSLSKFPCYSADSTSHRLRCGYNKVYTRRWGTISLTDKGRSSKVKSNRSFLRTCDKETYREFEKLVESYGLTVELVKNDNSARVAMDICETQKAINNEFAYHPSNLKRSMKLF